MDNSGPAFPNIEDIERFDEDLGKYVPHLVPQGGLTKRELFAAMVLSGMWHSKLLQYPEMPALAVEQADALLKKLEETREKK